MSGVGPGQTIDEVLEAQQAERRRFEAIDRALANWKPSHRDDSIASLLAQPAPVGLGDLLRYDGSQRQPWLIWWPGLRWQPDTLRDRHELLRSRLSTYLAHSTSHVQTAELAHLHDMSRQDSVLKAMSTMMPFKVPANYFDTDTNLLGVQNGVVDLTTGKLRDGRPEDRISKATGVEYEAEADCPRFESFLSEVTARDIDSPDDDLRDYLLLTLGYMLAGGNAEERFMQWKGVGGNGKGKLKDILLYVFGDYATSTQSTMFMRTRSGPARESAPNPAMLELRHLRVAFSSEPEGGDLNEERLKMISGRDEVNERYLYSNDSVRFRSDVVVVLLTNKLLRIEDTDQAFRQRLIMVPFDQEFRGTDREDPHLLDKLKDEAPGILALLVRQAVEYRKQHGAVLTEAAAPERARTAAVEYFDANNPLGPWKAARLVRDAGALSMTGDLFEDYENWHAEQGWGSIGDKLSKIEFGRKVGQLGMQPGRTSKLKGWAGWRLRTAAEIASSTSEVASR